LISLSILRLPSNPASADETNIPYFDNSGFYKRQHEYF
jgi:hypothetical protein